MLFFFNLGHNEFHFHIAPACADPVVVGHVWISKASLLQCGHNPGRIHMDVLCCRSVRLLDGRATGSDQLEGEKRSERQGGPDHWWSQRDRHPSGTEGARPRRHRHRLGHRRGRAPQSWLASHSPLLLLLRACVRAFVRP